MYLYKMGTITKTLKVMQRKHISSSGKLTQLLKSQFLMGTITINGPYWPLSIAMLCHKLPGGILIKRIVSLKNGTFWGHVGHVKSCWLKKHDQTSTVYAVE